MELLARYLHAVRQWLPRKQQADITAELSDSIQSQMEDKEAQLGRPLDIDEESAILKQYGPPMQAASRYWSQQYLIGPTLLPYYWNILRIVLPLALVLEFAGLWIAALSTDQQVTVAALWGLFWSTVVGVVGIVTIVFAALERYQSKTTLGGKWDPRSLPPADDKRRVARSSSIVELVINIIFVGWLLEVQMPRQLVAHTSSGGHVTFVIGPWLHTIAMSLAAACLIHVVLDCLTLVRPDWWRLRAGAFTATSAFLFTVLCTILATHPLIALAGGAMHTTELIAAAAAFNSVTVGGLACFAIGNFVAVVAYGRQLLRRSDYTLLNVGVKGMA